ncbi:hypothetical protein KDA11_06365 [Candidatus Saccharibacteria bacterium]|nr:hypothetical protein [Candidatus Saccharibacteria bacterium]
MDISKLNITPEELEKVRLDPRIEAEKETIKQHLEQIEIKTNPIMDLMLQKSKVENEISEMRILEGRIFVGTFVALLGKAGLNARIIHAIIEESGLKDYVSNLEIPKWVYIDNNLNPPLETSIWLDVVKSSTFPFRGLQHSLDPNSMSYKTWFCPLMGYMNEFAEFYVDMYNRSETFREHRLERLKLSGATVEDMSLQIKGKEKWKVAFRFEQHKVPIG